MARPITSVTITIETTHAEFGHVTNNDMNGVHDDDSITFGVVHLLRKYTSHIATYGVEHYADVSPIIGIDGQTVGRIIIEREGEQS